jgi:hypothetical protein
MHAFAWNYVAFMAAVLALVLFGLGFLNNRARRNREEFARSVPAVARVLRIGKSTSSSSYRAVVVDLLIQVHRPGVEPYELSTMWSVQHDSVQKVQPGQTFAIKIDPENPSRIYSGEAWAQSLGVKKNPIERSHG